MRTRPIYKIGAIVLSIVLIACGTGSTTDEATSDKINVLATTPMLGDFVNQIGGDDEHGLQEQVQSLSDFLVK